MGGKPRTPKSQAAMLLIRKDAKWKLWGRYDDSDLAYTAYVHSVQYRGITPWAWWGLVSEGEKMLADPSYTPEYPEAPTKAEVEKKICQL